MDLAGEIQRVVSMRRDSGGSVWRSRKDDDVFSRSSSREADHVDDEEALRWAALEKLPTRATACGAPSLSRLLETKPPPPPSTERWTWTHRPQLHGITNTLEEAATALRLVRSRKRKMPVLHDVSGVIKPRRLSD